MTQLTTTQIQEFIHLYKKHFGIELSEKEALEYAIKLLTFTKHALLPNIQILGEK